MRRITSFAGLALAVLAWLGAVAPARAQTANDYTTYYQWRADRRLEMKIDPDPDGSNLRPDGTASARRRAEKYTYDADGQLIQTDVGTVASVAMDASGVVTVTDWAPQQTTRVRYDAVGNKTQVYANGGTTGASLTQTRYDVDDRPLCVATRMNADTFQAQYDASALPDACAPGTAGTQGPDRITKTVYDAARQVTQVIQALGTADQRTYATYTYTDSGKQASIKDARQNLTTLRYDGFDRLCRQEFPVVAVSSAASNGPPAPQGQAYLACRATLAEAQAAMTGDFEEYGYDKSGNKTWQRKRDNGGLSYTYDALNRMTAKSGANIATVNYAYDLTGKPTSALFASGPDNGRGVTYGYDTAGRMSRETSFDPDPAKTRELKFQYDAAGNRIRVTWPDGAYAAYDYDAASQPKTAAGWTGGTNDTLAASLTYVHDDLGRRSDLNRASNAKDHFGYDPGNRPTSWTLTFTGTGKNQSDVLGYNPASQLVSEALGNDLYRWTGVGNDRTATADGLNRDATLVTIGGYDLNQNLIRDNTRSFTYDGENRLTTVTGPASATLSYDPLGRLRETSIGGVVTQFLYDGDKLTAEFSGSSTTPLRRYLHGVGTDVPLVWFEGAGLTDVRYLHPDRQGSIVAWSDASGGAQATYTYGPYGEPGDNWAAGSRFRYTGQIALPELKLYHYKARAYDPVRGWFLQTDPIGYKDDLNMYAYVGNDPLNGSDPTGTSSQDIQIAKVRAAAFLRGFAKEGVDTVGGLAKVGGIWTPDVTGQRGRTIDSQVAWVNSKLGEPNSSATQKAEVLGRAAFFGLGLLTGSAEAKGTTTLYRAVGPEEAAQIMKTGTFGVGPNSMGGKWFAESLGDAQRWGKLFGGDFSVMSVRLPTSDANSLMRVERLDGVGPARYGEIDQLRRAKIEPVN